MFVEKKKMKNTLLFVLIALPLMSFAQDLKIETKDASVSFTFVNDKVTGTLDDITASIQLNPSDLSKSIVSGSANVASIKTGVKMRDNHLRSDSYFDVEKYPTMKFTSSEIVKDGDDFKAKGTLTIKDVTKDVTFILKQTDSNLVFTTTIYASDFGVSVKKGRDKNKVNVTVTVPIN